MNSQKIIINAVKIIVVITVPISGFEERAKPIKVTIEEAKILTILFPNNITIYTFDIKQISKFINFSI